MILQSLNELYGRLAADSSYGIAPPGFSPQKISFRVVLNTDGTLFEIEDAQIKNDRGKSEPSRMEVPAHEKRTSGIKAQFLCDKQEYLLGSQTEGKKDGAGSKCFEEFKRVHLSYEKEIDSADYSILCRFLEKWSPSDCEQFKDRLKEVGSNFGVIQIRGAKKCIHDDPKIKNWWIKIQSASEIHEEKQQCLVSGESTLICGIHPDIKGFKSSIALVGIQEKTSYESYGKSKTENCPIGESVAFRYATALNALLDGPLKGRHRINISGTTAVFWTEKPSMLEDCLADIFSGASQQQEDSQDQSRRDQIQRLLQAIRSGGHFSELGELDTPFYILGLEQPNPGRFAIRFFHRSTIGELLSKLHSHQMCLEIERQYENETESPTIWQILDETAPRHRDASGKYGKPDSEKIPPLLGGALTRAIIQGTPYPEGLFAAIIGRIRADRTVNYLRAATLKAILTRNHHHTITTMLDSQNTDPAYLLGRLFAALEKTQEDALGVVNAGLRDRFYGSASATPAAVFPKLLRTYQHHLSKLNGGAKILRDKLVQEILSGISSEGFPKQFPLREQGIFAIGYYHQRKDFFTKKDQTSVTETQD